MKFLIISILLLSVINSSFSLDVDVNGLIGNATSEIVNGVDEADGVLATPIANAVEGYDACTILPTNDCPKNVCEAKAIAACILTVCTCYHQNRHYGEFDIPIAPNNLCVNVDATTKCGKACKLRGNPVNGMICSANGKQFCFCSKNELYDPNV